MAKIDATFMEQEAARRRREQGLPDPPTHCTKCGQEPPADEILYSHPNVCGGQPLCAACYVDVHFTRRPSTEKAKE